MQNFSKMHFSQLWSVLASIFLAPAGAIPFIRNDENGLGNTYIVGGTEAMPHEFPWIVSLRSSLNELHLCGGVILDSRTVLSTAACAELLSPYFSTVAAGKHNLTATEPSQEIVQVTSTHLHPNYANQGDHSNDIAIIKVTPEFYWTESVQPLPLQQFPPPVEVNDDGDDDDDDEYVIAGWGTKREEDIDLEETLQKATVDVMDSNSDCQLLVGSLVTIEDSMMCIRSPNPQVPVDSCNGDQGSPLVSFDNDDGDEDEDNTPQLVGLVSFGIGCGRPNMPSFCTRVAPYSDFISQYLESKVMDDSSY